MVRLEFGIEIKDADYDVFINDIHKLVKKYLGSIEEIEK